MTRTMVQYYAIRPTSNEWEEGTELIRVTCPKGDPYALKEVEVLDTFPTWKAALKEMQRRNGV